ncbi:MAG: hypothetical protein Kow00128_10610 [Deltaproteobacteria bacterium]
MLVGASDILPAMNRTKLEQVRRDAGLSREALAKAARVPENLIQRIERGDPPPVVTARDAVKIAVALNTPAPRLFEEADE